MVELTPIIVTAINPLFSLLSLMFTGFMTYVALKINKKADEAKKVTDATHILVNSNMGLQLKMTMVLAERVADLTKKPKDIRAANLAKKLYNEHEKKQAVVDQSEAVVDKSEE